MLDIVSPCTSVLLLVRVSHGALSVLLALLKLAYVDLAVSPRLLSISVHVSFNKIASVSLLLVRKVVGALSVEHAVLEVSIVEGGVGPLEAPFSALLALNERANIARVVRLPSLDTCTLLLVLDPLALESVAVRV